jgi:chemotaxis protein CheC
MNNNTLGSFERDMLLEAASIAAGKTIKAVGNIIGQPATIVTPQLSLASMEHIADLMGKPQDIRTIVFVRIMGEARGAIVLLVDPKDVGELLANVDGKLRLSALEETTNVIAGSALGSLSKLLNILFLQSVPASTTDMLRAVVNEIVVELGSTTEEILCMVAGVQIGTRGIPISMYILFDAETTHAVIKAGNRVAKRQRG